MAFAGLLDLSAHQYAILSESEATCGNLLNTFFTPLCLRREVRRSSIARADCALCMPSPNAQTGKLFGLLDCTVVKKQALGKHCDVYPCCWDMKEC